MGVKASFTAAVAFVAAAAAFSVARADDYGPRRDVTAIRHDVPILLASRFGDGVAVDDVTVSGN